jgi:hypothetical protein
MITKVLSSITLVKVDLYFICEVLVSTQCPTMGSHCLHDYVSISYLDEDFITTHMPWLFMITYMSSPTIFPSNFDLHFISDLLVSTQCTTTGSHLPNDFVSLDCLDENFIIALYMDEKGTWGWDKDLNPNWHWYLCCITCFLCDITVAPPWQVATIIILFSEMLKISHRKSKNRYTIVKWSTQKKKKKKKRENLVEFFKTK